MGRKPSVASQVVRQARSQTTVTDLEAGRLERTTSVRGIDPETNAPFLKAIFPDAHQTVEIDLSFLLNFPGLQTPFLEGFRRRGSGLQLHTKQEAASNLARYFFRFLAENELFEIDFAELDRPLFIGFIGWLDRPDVQEVGTALSLGTRKHALANVRALINALLRSKTWGNVARRVRQAIPDRVWPGAHLKATPKPQLDLEHMRAIVRAAEAEIDAIKLRFDHREALVRSGHEALERRHERGDLDSFLAIIAERYPTIIPGLTEMQVADRTLAQEMRTVHTQRGVTQYFYAGSRDLIPFIILILAATAFNPETVLTALQRGARSPQCDSRSRPRLRARRTHSLRPSCSLARSTIYSGWPSALAHILRQAFLRSGFQPRAQASTGFSTPPRNGRVPRMSSGIGRANMC